jgi:hypothetical protein
MPDEIIIPGGVEEWLGRRFDDFAVGAKHTVFEWCMIYTDHHPTAVLGDDSRTATARFLDMRLTLLGARGSNEPRMRPHPTETDRGVWDDMMIYRTRNAVYQELVEGRLDAERRYRDDRPGEPDPTLCILDAAPVLAIARRRKDYGQYIGRLLATQDDATAPSVTEGDLGVDGTVIDGNGQTDGAPDDLRPASDRQIHVAITTVYNEAERTGTKPPNIKEVREPVQHELRKTRHTASGNHIMRLAGVPQHNRRRRKPGKTLASEKKRNVDCTK